MTAKWMVYAKKADFEGIGRKYGISAVTARIMRNRDVVGDQAVERYLKGKIEDLYPPWGLPNLEQAVSVLEEKIRDGRLIRIVGDYDIDGVCSTYILYRALQRVGALADYEIPDRIRDGYGINELIIEAAAADGVDTILTCDNGIAAVDQIARAKELGLTVIITDHHDILQADGKEMVPPADVIVNPKLASSTYPFKELCGAVVAYKLVQALYEKYQIPRKEWEEMLEFAAIATVGDVMRLQDENRIIVKEGLKRIPQTTCIGLRKLIEKNNLDIENLSAYHIGFVIGPCLNAGGRLQSAKLALSMLLCTEEAKADQIARELKELNDTRKEMTKEAVLHAAEQVEDRYMDDKVLVVYLPGCHESLAGIIAGRLRERYHKPSFVLTKSEEGVKGSGRSIEGYPMFERLVQVKHLLTKFGGHPMAAGLSLNEENTDRLRMELNQKSGLTGEDFIPKIWIDVPMPIEYITEPLVKELELLEPFGQGNEKPRFAQKHVHIRSVRVMGKNRNAVKLSLMSDQGTVMDGLVFSNGDVFEEELGSCRTMDIIYYPGVNEYNGNRSLQIVIEEYKFLE